TGVEEIRRRRLREIKPYASGEWREGVPLVGRSGLDAGVRASAGIEVAKLGITPSLTAEFTVNPDFGQAEVDDQIVNLSRFSVFRVKRDILKRSYVGAILVNRQGATAIGSSNYNRVGGADAEFNLTDHYKVKASWMGSATPGIRSGAGSSRLESIFENDLYR